MTASCTNNKHLRVVRIVEGTSVDGPGLRTSIYFAGCSHNCPGCHNAEIQDFTSGHDMSVDEIMDVVRYNAFPVTFSGGDPMYQAKNLIPLAEAIRNEGLDIWCYTGFTLEELRRYGDSHQQRLLDLIDTLVDGPYIEALRDTTLLFRGSSNQKIINLNT